MARLINLQLAARSVLPRFVSGLGSMPLLHFVLSKAASSCVRGKHVANYRQIFVHPSVHRRRPSEECPGKRPAGEMPDRDVDGRLPRPISPGSSRTYSYTTPNWQGKSEAIKRCELDALMEDWIKKKKHNLQLLPLGGPKMKMNR